ncbi:MAG: hypothetical protein U0230_25760 [Polyangiales bacterium]
MTRDVHALLTVPASRGIRLRALDLLERARSSSPSRGSDAHTDVEAVASLHRWLAIHARPLSDATDTKAARAAAKTARRHRAHKDAALGVGILGSLEVDDRRVLKIRKGLEQRRDELAAKLPKAHERFLGRVDELASALDHLVVAVRAPEAEPSFAAVLGGLLRLESAGLAADLASVDSVADLDTLRSARDHASRLAALLEAAAGAEGGDTAMGLVRAVERALEDATVHADLVVRLVGDPDEADLETGLSAVAGAALDGFREAFTTAEDELDALDEALESLSRRLEGDSTTETEYKFLLTAVPPEARRGRAETLSQGYVPGKRLHERIRKVVGADGTTYVRTVKLGVGAQRIEIEEETDEAIYEGLWALTQGKRVEKIRYSVDDGGLTWTVDKFTDRDLVLAEVEVPSLDVVPGLPSWLSPYVVREVTNDPQYVNLNLAR